MNVIFIRSFNPYTDSRLRRYWNFLNSHGISYTTIAWDRDGSTPRLDNVIYFTKKSKIAGGYKNILNLFLWNLFIIKILWVKRKSYNVIHGVDLDTALPAAIFKLFFRKLIIFDVYDSYADARNMPPSISGFVNWIERSLIKYADLFILPDPCRLAQVKYYGDHLIIENVPSITNDNKEIVGKSHSDKLHIVYTGTLEGEHRGLEDLISVVKYLDHVTLTIAGSGELSKWMEQEVKGIANIQFLGVVQPLEALNITRSADIIIALYYTSCRNHFYAAPNKYYEHLIFGKPMITTINTPPGNKVLELNTGWAIAEGKDPLISILNSITKNDISEKGANAQFIWKTHFGNEYQRKLADRYVGAIKERLI